MSLDFLVCGNFEQFLAVTILYTLALSASSESSFWGGGEGAMTPAGSVKISHKKDGRQRRPHRFRVSRPPLTRPLDPLLSAECVILGSARQELRPIHTKLMFKQKRKFSLDV